MAFSFDFLEIFGIGLRLISPLLIPFIILMILLGQRLGTIERWTRLDALYFTIITSLTVGYGDFRPSKPHTKIMALCIGCLGIVINGIVVAVAINAANVAYARWLLRAG